MNNEFAIAAVTLIMRELLEGVQNISSADDFDAFPDDVKPTNQTLVTTLPLDEAYEFEKASNQVNLFLYHVEHSPTWRNMDIPGRLKPGESGHTPLALNLYYIVTAYGENHNEIIGHMMLGKAMSIFHDHPLLGRKELKEIFRQSGLHCQIERVRITPQPISLEEVSKLWTGFQTQYRLCAAYQVSVVLIESKRAAAAPLPVLTIGKNNAGIHAQSHVIPPYPTLEIITFPNKQTGALLGNTVVLSGHHLDGDTVTLRFRHPLWETAVDAAASAGGTAEKINVEIPNNTVNWPSGYYNVSAIIDKGGVLRTTNELPMALLPEFSGFGTVPLSPPISDSCLATVSCSPQVWPDQKVSLLLDDREFTAQFHPSKTPTLSFRLLNLAAGDYYARLRVDGVDSMLVNRNIEPPVFVATKEVSVP